MEVKPLPPPIITNETLSRHNLYGVVFNGVGSKGKPLYNAIDQKWTPATPTDPGVDTWKDLAPFNVKKCITDYDANEPYKRKVLAYEGDANYDTLKANKTGDRMIEFPLGYYYRPDPWTFIVSSDPIEGFQPSPGHDLGNGVILNGFRLSEFDLTYVDSTPRSIPSGVTPWVRVILQTMKDTLKTKGQYVETFGAWCWINFLRAIKQRDLNSQKINGVGIYQTNSSYTVIEDNIQGLDGYISLNENNHVRTLGLQNFYGNVFNFLHNAIVYNSKLYVKKDFLNADTWPTYSNAETTGWKQLSVLLPSNASATFFSELAYNSDESWALYPSKLGGNSEEPIGDGCWIRPENTFSSIYVGAGPGYGTSTGSLSWVSWRTLADTADPTEGCRSMEAF